MENSTVHPRKIIAAMQISLDGYIEGLDGALDWIESWADTYDLVAQVDALILGGGMYAGYEHYWRSILNDPEGILALTGSVATPEEVAYAHFADKTPHYVLSKSIVKTDWRAAKLIRDIAEITALKAQPGGDIYAVGGAMMIGSLLNINLLDEIRLTLHPIILGAGKALFKDVTGRHRLELLRCQTLSSGRVGLVYGVVR
jgi:dihydrofolate reductase